MVLQVLIAHLKYRLSESEAFMPVEYYSLVEPEMPVTYHHSKLCKITFYMIHFSIKICNVVWIFHLRIQMLDCCAL